MNVGLKQSLFSKKNGLFLLCARHGVQCIYQLG